MEQEKSNHFQINDYVMYGGNGVCIVEDICTLDGSGIDNARKYYRLRPVFENGSTVYAPIDNVKSTLRNLLSKEETNELLSEIPSIEPLTFRNEKALDAEYKNALQTYSCEELARVAKTAFIRIQERKQQNKKTILADERYFNRTKNLLCGALSIALGITKEQMETHFTKKTLLFSAADDETENIIA